MHRRYHRQAGAPRPHRRARRPRGRDLRDHLRLVPECTQDQKGKAQAACSAGLASGHGTRGRDHQSADHPRRGQHDPDRQPRGGDRLRQLAVRLAPERAQLLGTAQLGQKAGSEAGALKLRAFFGLPLPDSHREELGRYLAGCAELAPEFRWTPADNLHLTIRFLGHVDRSLAEGIAERVVLAAPKGFDVELGALGMFKRGKLARVVWLGLDAGAVETGALAELVEAECVRTGLEAEVRRYHAHLTLARARPRDGAKVPELPTPPALERWRAGELILYRSHLGRAGSVYEPLRRISLS
ncbi:MAG: RNA 2',3'-cyclic phosphodiesterase [Chloroflexi bacterium]|nr:MAG: RNA 2',3'-cyclic phosphodiesterase [Chloroflexota bacterium]